MLHIRWVQIVEQISYANILNINLVTYTAYNLETRSIFISNKSSLLKLADLRVIIFEYITVTSLTPRHCCSVTRICIINILERALERLDRKNRIFHQQLVLKNELLKFPPLTIDCRGAICVPHTKLYWKEYSVFSFTRRLSFPHRNSFVGAL